MCSSFANGMLAEQERLGVPEYGWQVLPQAAAQDLVVNLVDLEPHSADRMLRDLADAWGTDWPRALRDLTRAGLPSEYALLGSIDNLVARHGFAKVLAAKGNEPGFLSAIATNNPEAGDRVLTELAAAAEKPIEGGTVVPSAATTTSNPPSQKPSYRGAAYPKRNPVDLHDANGKPVMGIDEKGNPSQIQVPEGVDLSMFARMGQEDNKLPGHIRGEVIRKRLENFVQGGMWDLQRPRLQSDGKGGYIVYQEFVDVASVAIGIYSAAAGLTRYECFIAQSVYASNKSHFGNAKRHWLWQLLPERNVLNTNLGYDLYAAGTVPGPAE